MIKEDQIVNAESCVETKPDYDNRGERDGNLRSTERLDQEEKNQNGACGSNNGGFGDIWFDDVEPLDSTKNRLGWTSIEVSTM